MSIADLIGLPTAGAASRSQGAFSSFIMYWMDDGDRETLSAERSRASRAPHSRS